MRLVNTYFYCLFKGFNPRICKRCDDLIRAANWDELVSIHASVKDATNRFYSLQREYMFQSTHL